MNLLFFSNQELDSVYNPPEIEKNVRPFGFILLSVKAVLVNGQGVVFHRDAAAKFAGQFVKLNHLSRPCAIVVDSVIVQIVDVVE